MVESKMNQETQRTSETTAGGLLLKAIQSAPNKGAFYYQRNSFSQMVVKPSAKQLEIIQPQISNFKLHTKVVEEKLQDSSSSHSQEVKGNFTNLDSPINNSLINLPYDVNNVNSSISSLGASPRANKQNARKKFVHAFKQMKDKDKKKVIDQLKSIMIEPSVFVPMNPGEDSPRIRTMVNEIAYN